MEMKMKPLLLAGLISSGYMLASPLSFAAPAPANSEGAIADGYVYDASGLAVRTSNGDCVRTSSWTPDMATAQCDPDLVQRAAAPVEQEPAAAQAAPSEPPAPATSEVAAIEPQRQPININEKALFDFDRSVLKEQDRKRLDEVITELKDAPEAATIRITGHTDSIGSEEYNRDLSMRRARAAEEYLVSNGIPEQRIVISGMGESNPVADNDSDEGRAQNRRAEIEVQAEAGTGTEGAPAGTPGNQQPSPDQGTSGAPETTGRIEGELLPTEPAVAADDTLEPDETELSNLADESGDEVSESAAMEEDPAAAAEETPNPDEEDLSSLPPTEETDQTAAGSDETSVDDRAQYSEARPSSDISSMKNSPTWPRPVGWDK